MTPPETSRYRTPAAALFVLLIGAAWLTAWGWKQSATSEVIERELQRSIAVATSLSNALGPLYLKPVRRAATLPPTAIPQLDFLAALGRDVAAQIKGQRVLKVKIYDPRGVVVFSTEAKQIGEDNGGNLGVRAALNGKALAELVHREQFSVIDGGLVADRDLVQAYVPANPGADGPQDAVFEVYTDVTPLIAEIKQDERRVWAIANLAGLVIFAVALHVLRRAERTQREKDAVTGLPVREVALDVLARRQRHDVTVAPAVRRGWLVVGLLHLRQVSAAYGHRATDAVLRQTADRLATLPNAGHRLFRLPGDAFALMLKQEDATVSAEEMLPPLAREILAKFDAPLLFEGQNIVADVAMGADLAESGGSDPAGLLMHAEAALGQAKAQGARHWVLYTPGLEQGVAERLQLQADLREALQRQEFEVFYQPLVDAGTRQLLSAEALVRWRHPHRGLMSPTVFIPLLEESGQIVEVGAFVLRQACKQAQRWRQSFMPEFVVAVNLSTRQFTDPRLPAIIREALAESGLPAAALILEVTETFLALNPDQAAGLLRELKGSLGVAVAIDDFGQGYSSLASLRQMPVDILKIDRAFVINAPHDPVDASIARAIAALAQGLDLTLVAEGVETEAQAEFTRGIGCHKLQGYLFAKPLEASAFEAAYGPSV
ncbi:MAG: phosphodiesterase [Sulfurisoma sp.]|nr:phosphodiesterase [Sulfurisoma sp.]